MIDRDFYFLVEQLFNFLSDPLNMNFVFIIGENIKLFLKTFRQYLISTNATFFKASKKPGGMIESSIPLIFLKSY